MVGKYLNGYGIDDGIPEPSPTPARSRRAGPTGTRSPAASTSAATLQAERAGQDPLLQAGDRNYVTDVLAEQGGRLRQAAGAEFRSRSSSGSTPPRPTARPAVRSARRAIRSPRRATWAATRGRRRPEAPNFDEADASDKPAGDRGHAALSDEEIADIDRRYRGRLESLLAVDDAVEADRRQGAEGRRQAQDLHLLHLRQRPAARRTPRCCSRTTSTRRRCACR